MLETPAPRPSLLIAAALASALMPAVAWGQAAVQSDTPLPRREGLPSADALAPAGGAGARDAGVPNAVTGPGSPGSTGTGAVGTGPSNTMAAPGR